MELSKRIQQTPASPIRRFAKYEEAARAKSVEVFKLNIGQPDLHTPKQIRKTFSHFKEDIVLYAPSNGLPETVDAWRSYYRSHGINVEREEIIVTMGGSEALLFAIMATCDPGDEIIVFEPFYSNFAGFAAMANVNLVPITLDINNDFAMPSYEEISAKITNKTRAVIFNNPNNPTGVVYSKKQMQELVNLCYKKNLYLISDEVYREFIFDDSPHISALNFPEISDRAIVIDSVSKRFNHCGGRVGCLVSRNRDLVAAILKMAQARLSVPTLEQLSVIPLLNRPKEYTDSVKEEYRKRRDIVTEAFSRMEGVTSVTPRGAFYALAELPVDDAEKFVIFMLSEFSDNNQTVMVTPAQGFYITPEVGKRQIRIAFVLNESQLERSMELLQKGLVEYNSRG